jgi:L-alanine-DL-glutamate epimerase-like enolase superfamily enzyme
MRIESIETFLRDPVALVRVRTDDGAEGWGQVSTWSADITVSVLHKLVADRFLGNSVDGFEARVSDVIMELNKYTGTFVCRAVAGVDTALWDLRAKAEGSNIATALGATSRRVRIYGSDMKRDTTPEQQIDRLLPWQDDMGVTAFKFKLGEMGAFGSDADTYPGRTEAIIPHIAKHLRAGVELIADANSSFKPETAIRTGRVLEEYGYAFFEEPCSWWDIEATAQVNAALEMPVCGGEQDFQLPQWRRMLQMGSVEVVQPDPCYIGGFTRTLEVARLAGEHGKRCMPHSANHSLVTLFAMVALAVMANPGPYGEFCIDHDSWCRDLFEPELKVVDGHIELPSGPGWGIVPNPEWLRAAEHSESRI